MRESIITDQHHPLAEQVEAMALDVRVQELERELAALRRPVVQSDNDSFSCDDGNCLSQQCTRCAVDPNGDDPKAYEGTGFYAPAEIRTELSALAKGADEQAESIEKSWSEHCRAIKADPERFSSANPTIVINYLISALDQAQRESRALRIKVEALEQRSREDSAALFVAIGQRDSNREAIELSGKRNQELVSALDAARTEIARLSSPPEERREIVHRRQCLEGLDGIGTVSAQGVREDIDTLLQDCARWRSANAVLLVERDSYARGAQMDADLCRALQLQIESLLVERDATRREVEALRRQSEQPRPAAGVDERLQADRRWLDDGREPDCDGVWWAMSEFRRIAKDAFAALDRSAQECAGLRERLSSQDLTLAAYINRERDLVARLASHDACLAHLREEQELHQARKDLLAEAQERIAELKSDLSAQIAQRLESGSKFAECLARLNAAEARERGLRDHIRWLLPMAKGWAAANPVGQNQKICNDAEAALAAQHAAVGREDGNV